MLPDDPPPLFDYKGLAAEIDRAGWGQFAFLKPADHSVVLGELHTADRQHLRWIVISHSCDLIHHSDQERDVEFIGVEELTSVPADEAGKQSPRMIFVNAYRRDTSTPVIYRARISQRVCVPRERLKGATPDDTISLRSASDPPGLRNQSENAIGAWLAARYNRGWTPTEFDRRLNRNVGKIQACLTRLRGHGVEEIFARVTPSTDLAADEPYEIQIIVLVKPESSENLDRIRGETRTLAGCVAQPGILLVAPPQVAISTDVGYGYLKGWLQFHDVFRDSLAAQRATSAPPALSEGQH